MEEIVTIDGKPYRLTYDQPLTIEQRTQAIENIKKQTECGSCGQKANQEMSMGRSARGNIYSLVPKCNPTAPIQGGSTITMNAAPTTGTAPYAVSFYKQIGCTITPIGTTQTGVNESPDGTAVTTTDQPYTITDADIVGAGPGCTTLQTVAGTDTVPVLATNTLRFITRIVDSCPTGALSCVEYCDLAIVCPTPTCNFIVT